MRTASTGLVLVLAGLVLAVVVIAKTTTGTRTEFVGTRIALGPGVQEAYVGSKELEVSTEPDAAGKPYGFVELDTTGPARITIARQGDALSTLEVNILPRYWFWIAAAGILFVLFGLPFLLQVGSGGRDKNDHPVGPWYSLLSEAAGGYSLGRVQLLVWFAPAAVIYGGLCVALHRFVDLDTSTAALLGLSGATTLLATAANPPKANAAQPGAPVESPMLSDLVTDWKEHGDLSRYQYLLLSIVGAITLVATFVSDFRLPAIPQQFLLLLGASQATYVGTKAVKSSKPDGTPAQAGP